MVRYDNNRPWKKLYSRKQWKMLRLNQLALHPLCCMCEKQGKLTAATVVDHIKPHKGDESLFFDPYNLQSLCKAHHDSAKQKAESKGITDIGCDEFGLPLDRNHHWSD